LQLEWSNENSSFYSYKHRTNNTGWMMKWGWREGVERSANPNILRECWTFLIRIFLHQMRKQCLEFALPNPGEICKHFAGAYNSYSQTRRPLLSYFSIRKNKQGNHHNGWGSSQKSSALSILFEGGETLAVFWSHWHCCQKTTIFFVNVKKDWNGGGEKKKICVH
jgi:hypothetical protein